MLPTPVQSEDSSRRSTVAARPKAVTDRHLSSTASGERFASSSETESGPSATAQAWTSSDPGVEANSASNWSRIGSYTTGDVNMGRAVENSSSVHGPVSSTPRVQTVESAKMKHRSDRGSKSALALGGPGGHTPLEELSLVHWSAGSRGVDHTAAP